MSYDLQFLRDRAPASVTMVRELAIYRDAEPSDRRVRKVRNVADVLETGHRPARAGKAAQVIDVKA
jgi:hypothetical protein